MDLSCSLSHHRVGVYRVLNHQPTDIDGYIIDIYIYIYLSIYVYMYICLSIYLSIDRSIYLSIYLSIYILSIYLNIQYIYIDTNLIEGSLEAKLPTIWTVEKQR